MKMAGFYSLEVAANTYYLMAHVASMRPAHRSAAITPMSGVNMMRLLRRGLSVILGIMKSC